MADVGIRRWSFSVVAGEDDGELVMTGRSSNVKRCNNTLHIHYIVDSCIQYSDRRAEPFHECRWDHV